MGKDIHMHIVKGKKVIAENIYNGRNSEWFDNLCGRGGIESDYYYFPLKWSIPDEVPDFIANDYNNSRGYDGYFDFFYVNVKEFKEWYNKAKPYLKAGWVNSYDKWRIEKKGWVPDYLPTYLNDDFNKNDAYFIEYEDKYEPSNWLYRYLEDNFISDDATIIYYFDA